MATFLYKTKGNSSPERKPRVYFTCHPDDFSSSFNKISEDIFRTHDCAIFYTESMTEPIEEKYKESDLGQMNLLVIAVTAKLLTEPNRAMDSDFCYAKQKGIPVLPIMLEDGLDAIYSSKDRFNELQYLAPCTNDLTAISYEEKLKKYLESVLISDEMAERVRKAFDAYIFLSYRKKDRHYANELMKKIHSYPLFRDIAIWYDEFLTPGESFRNNIKKMMDNSELFTLLVTPNLLEYVDGEPNFVMAHEYPDAKKAKMDILPAEMEETDKEDLRAKYKDIPDCVSPNEDEQFETRLANTLSKIALLENDDDPEHNFLIGLAYYDGIDVETDRDRGISLITSAAEVNYVEAMEMLLHIYKDAVDIRHGEKQFEYWSQRLADYYYEDSFSSSAHIKDQNKISELFAHYEDPYWLDAIKYFLINVDLRANENTMKALYNLIGSYHIQEYSLLFEAIQSMANHRTYSQMFFVEDILKKTMEGIYSPYGHLFWYIPEYNLYEIAIKAAWNMPASARIAALVRDVCFIFGQYDYVTQITNEIDGMAFYERIRSRLSGVRRGLCELFYTGYTDFNDADMIYPRCFNVREAKQMALSGMGVLGRMDTLFEDELGLFSPTKASQTYFGIVILPYDNNAERMLAGDLRFVRGIIFLNSSNLLFDYIEFFRSNIKVMYIPENCTEYASNYARHLDLSLFIKIRPTKKLNHYPDGTIAAKTFLSNEHTYIRKRVKASGHLTEIQPHYFQNFTELTSIEFPKRITWCAADVYCADEEFDPLDYEDDEIPLGISCFQNCTSLSSITLPENITIIESRAFSNCTSLGEIFIPKETNLIESEAFAGCTNLHSVFMERQMFINDYAFRDCKNLSSLHLESGADFIGQGAFLNCTSLHEVVFQQGLCSIREFAFSGSGLKNLRFPSQTGPIVTGDALNYLAKHKLYFGEEAFSHCHQLEDVILPDDLTKIPAACFLDCKALYSLHLPQQLEIIGPSAFEKCLILPSIAFPTKLKEIGSYAFDSCALTSVEIPQSVQLIGDFAFYNNITLESIKITNPVVKVGKSIFAKCNHVKYAELPETLQGKDLGLPSTCEIVWLRANGADERETLCIQGFLNIPAGGHYRSTHLKHLTIQDAVSIDEFAFWGCTSLESISVSDALTRIGDWAFAECSSLTEVPFLPQIVALSAGAFENCTGLSEAVLNPDISVIEGWTFAGCTNLTKLQFPLMLKRVDDGAFFECRCLTLPKTFEHLTEIGEHAFEACAQLKTIHLPAVEVIWDCAFALCDALESIDLGAKLQLLGSKAFKDCKNLNAIDLSRSSLDAIPNEAFCSCTELKEVTCPDSIESIGTGAFFECKSLSHITLPQKTLRYVEWGAFALCENLTSIYLPNVDWLSNAVFFGCTKLKDVQLSSKIRRIGSGAFAYCSSLESIQLGDQLQIIEEKAFSDCSSLKSIRIPLSVVSIGDGAFENCSSLSQIEISRNFQNDIQRIFGDITSNKITFIDTADSTHSFAQKTAEAPDLTNDSTTDSATPQDDSQLTAAISLLFEKKYLTVSMLQRMLRVGYAKAVDMIKKLQELGIVEYCEEQKRYVPLTSEPEALAILLNEAS